jgi:hypothetical protein
MKQDEAQAREMFATGEGGFKSKDLYVWCANASDGILTVHPTNKGKELRDIKGKHGAPFGETIMENAAEGTIKETTYWWPRPDSDEPSRRPRSTPRSAIRFAGSGTTLSERVAPRELPSVRLNHGRVTVLSQKILQLGKPGLGTFD